MSELRWYVGCLKPLENWVLVTEHLTRSGFEAFVPVERRVTFQAGYEIRVSRPLFWGYVLIKFDIEDGMQAWRGIRRIQGMQASDRRNALLPVTSEIPTPLPTEFVEELLGRPELKADTAAMIARKFAKHDLVKLIAGHLIGHGGPVISSSGTATWFFDPATKRRIKAATADLVRA